MLLLGIFDKVGVNIGLWITTPLFKLAAFAFKIFMILAQSDVLKQIDYKLLLTNFYVILGLIMLFIMAFALLRGIVNPDDQKQGTTVVKNIIINFVISCIILGFLPTIFPFMFDVQDSILRYNVIGGFFGYGDTGHELEISDNVNEVEASAYRLVNGVYTAFFNVSDGYCSNFLATSSETYNSKKEELEACQDSLLTDDELYDDGGVPIADSFLTFKQYVNQTGQFGVYSSFVDQISEGQIDFDFLILLIAGVALLYIGTSYCFDMGLRLIKLIFYQLIAPIPVFLRIVPNSKLSGTFNQWLKVTLTCWMEVFIRIFIFCFATWLCSAIMETDFITNTVYDYGRTTGLFTTAFILMAVIMFMKRIPKLLSEVTGIDSGNMKLGIREKLAEGGGLVAGAAIGAGATTLVRNAVAARENFKGNFADVKGKTGREKAKAITKGGLKTFGAVFKSAGSMAAGATSGLVSGGKAGWGAKNEKDMISAVGKGAANAVETRRKRATYKASHPGFGGVIKGHITDNFEEAKAWAGIELDYSGLQAERASSDAMLKSISNISSISDDYVTKHQSEFYSGLSDQELAYIEDLRKKFEDAKKSGNTSTISRFDNLIKQFDQQHGNQRLDVMEQNIEVIKKRGQKANQTEADFAMEIAEAQNKYNKALKDTKDGFASLASRHVGAEKENLAIEAEYKIINDKLQENANSLVSKTLRNGDPNHIVTPTAGLIDESNATNFIKQLKSSAEITNSEINQQYEKLQRRSEAKKGQGK